MTTSIRITPKAVTNHLRLGGMPGPGGSPGPAAGPDTITNTELLNMLESRIKGRAAGAGTGDPQDLTPAQMKTMLGYLESSQNLADLQSVPAARTQLGLGPVALDSVVPIARGGTGNTTAAAAQVALGIGAVKVGSGSGNAAAFWMPQPAGYVAYRHIISDLEPNTSGATAFMRASIDNQMNTLVGNSYLYNSFFHGGGAAGYLAATSSAQTAFQITNGMTNTLNNGFTMIVDVVTAIGNNPFFMWRGGYALPSTYVEVIHGAGRINGTGATVTDVLIGMSSGTMGYRFSSYGMLGS